MEENPTADAVFNKAMEHFNAERYARSIHFFERIRDEFPFSPRAVDAELKMAEAYYLNGQYPEAITAFKDFLSLRPMHEKAPWIIYHLGLAHFDQFTAVDRDQKNIEIARDYFAKVVKVYPKSPHAPAAREKMAKCSEHLAEQEFYVASFYLREKNYPAATMRLENILRRYRDTPTAVKALYLLGDSYRSVNNTVKAGLAYEALVQHYPDSPLAGQARTQLSRLDGEKQDPLAMLLMRDGRPVFIPPVENGRLLIARGQPKEKKDIELVAKKDVVYEEPGVSKGVFRRVVDTINPFGSDEKEDSEKEEKEDKKDGTRQKSNGFFSSLWPFGKGKESKPDLKRDPELVGKIDDSLKEKGITPGQELVSRPPSGELPRIEEEPPPSPANTAEVLSKIDESLDKQGKAAPELPAAPKPSSKLFVRPANAKPKSSASQPARDKGKASPSTVGLLRDIDRGLKDKAHELPDIPPAPVSRSEEKGTSPQGPKEKIELAPRLVKEKNPYLLDEAGSPARERPDKEKTEAGRPQTLEASRPAGPSAKEPPKALPEAVVKGPPDPPVKEEQPVKKRPGELGIEEEETTLKGVFEQLGKDMEGVGKLLNPFEW